MIKGYVKTVKYLKPLIRDNLLVITYGFSEIMLELSGPFRAGGQYHMKVFKRVKGLTFYWKKLLGDLQGAEFLTKIHNDGI
jgi:hypothetical protein